ncbi:hypothetical protein [Natrinema pallidum]|uniref:Uncharacterized protein n=1 Tax=Natrinema pallidum DSM 3751 TaxID=1227495 RepID=L9YT05_9EURY|nr:hypothetical protein [Natrinema pallidum]ELY76821.1 hypothetical protein C487_09982 [Natrinema pallidum DSM 3751]
MVWSERWSSVGFGCLLFVVCGWTAWANSQSTVGAPATIALVASGWTALGATAFVTAGRRDRITVGDRRLEWWQIQGLGFVCLGTAVLTPAASGMYAWLNPLTRVLLAGAFGINGALRLRYEPSADDPVEPSVRRLVRVAISSVVVWLAVRAVPF